jgi:hypothetical protein
MPLWAIVLIIILIVGLASPIYHFIRGAIAMRRAAKEARWKRYRDSGWQDPR